MSAVLRLGERITRNRTLWGVLGVSLALHLAVLAVLGLRTGLDISGYRAPPELIYVRIEPRPLMLGETVREPPVTQIEQPREAPILTRNAQALSQRLRDEEEEDERQRLDALRLPARADAERQDIEPRWQVQAEETTGDRVARALRGGGLACDRPRGEMTQAERAACDDRFARARAAPGIRGTGDPERDAAFERQGWANRAQWEAQRAPLAGQTGVIGPADCVGSNLGMGCAGAHLPDVPGVDMRQGARTPVQQQSNRPPQD